MTTFAEATTLVPLSLGRTEARFGATAPVDWVQGRTTFGGLAGAMMIRAAEQLPAVAGLPFHSFDVAFIGPLPAGPVLVESRVLRDGKYVTHVAASIRPEAESVSAATAHMVMGHRRESGIDVVAEPPGARPDRGSMVALPYLEGITPVFTQYLDYVYATPFPFTGATEPRIAGYCRHATRASGAAALVALADGWPAPVLPMLTAPAPASSVRWSMHWPGDEEIDGNEWLWYEAETVWASGGYGTSVARLWRDDTLVAWSEQLVTVFDRRT